MHDPLTQAFEIHWPWNYLRMVSDRRKINRYKDTPRLKRTETAPNRRYFTPALTIWHKDPERRGSDDSCGWFTPPMSQTLRKSIENMAWHEAYSPIFQRTRAKTQDDLVLAEHLMRAAFLYTSRALDINLTPKELQQWPIELVFNPAGNGLSSLAFLSGWHTDNDRDDQEARQSHANRLLYMIAGYIRRNRRPWYKHPRWHVHHWQFQLHTLQTFKRWAFSRCCKCGSRFSWGYSPCSGSWSGTGPLWFRSEKNVYHSSCDTPRSA